jgi:hypothetical protein
MVSRKKVAGPVHEVQEKVHEVQEFVVVQLEEARRRLQQYEKDLLALGRSQQHEIEALLERVKTGKELKLLEKRASEATSEVKKRLDGVQTQVLSVLGVASQDQIKQISRELGRLSKKVDTLTRKGGIPQAKA